VRRRSSLRLPSRPESRSSVTGARPASVSWDPAHPAVGGILRAADLFTELLPDAQHHLVELIHGLRIRYDLGDPLAGAFAADAVEHLRDGRGVLLADESLHAVAAPWADRVRCVRAACFTRWFGAGKLAA
jgi:hypothetical protein